VAVSLPATLVVLPFAVWRARRQRTTPPPPSDEPLRRIAGLLILGVGATLTLIGAVLVFVGLAFVFETSQKANPTFVYLPLFLLPLLVGQ
jgi:hypothetical protein